jgi:ribosomal protein S8
MKIDKQFTRVFEDELTIETWTYNPAISTKGPISIDIKYKAGAEKVIKQRAENATQEKKTARQMKKINNRNK